MNIRPAEPRDVEQVLPLVQKLADVHEAWDAEKYPYLPNIGQMYRSWLTSRARDKRSVFIVAEREERIVAFLIGTVEREIPIYRVKEFGFIHDVWVEPDRTFERKDEDELELAVEQGRYTPERAAEITAVADEIEEVIKAWGPPFCDGWETFRPDPSWPVPTLP